MTFHRVSEKFYEVTDLGSVLDLIDQYIAISSHGDLHPPLLEEVVRKMICYHVGNAAFISKQVDLNVGLGLVQIKIPYEEINKKANLVTKDLFINVSHVDIPDQDKKLLKLNFATTIDLK